MRPTVTRIYSENNDFQYVDTLRRRREKRHKQREFFAVPVVRVPGPADLLPWFETIRRTIGPFQIVGSSAKATTDIAEHDFSKPTVLLVGNETWGLSAAFKELCDVMVTIPIGGSATSLNVACAASIILYEIDRQRRRR